jgi:hypothetical protein
VVKYTLVPVPLDDVRRASRRQIGAWGGISALSTSSSGSNGSVPRSIPDVESSVVNKVDPLGQTWRKSRPMGNGRLPIGRHQPRSQKAGHHPEGIPRPISERNLTFAYELEAWWMAGCRHGQQQALSRWRDSKRIRVPIDCLQRSLGHGRMSPRFSLGAAHRVVTARGDRADKHDPDRSLSRPGAESAHHQRVQAAGSVRRNFPLALAGRLGDGGGLSG